MTRSCMLLFGAFASAVLAQTTCPVLNFYGPQTVNLHPEPASHLDLIRQADGSWTAFQVNDLDPDFVVGATPHFETQITGCLPPGLLKGGPATQGAPSALSGAYVPAPAAIGPGKILELSGLSGSSIPFTVFDSQHAVISSGALHLSNTPGATIGSAGIAEATGDGKLDVLATVQNPPGTNASPTSLWIFPGHADGTFGSGIERALPALTQTVNLAVGDVNGDGVPDVVFADIAYGGGGLFVALGPAGNHFNIQTIPLPPDFIISARAPVVGRIGLRIADWNGDNRPDIMLAGSDVSGAGRVAVLPGDGKGGFNSQVSSQPLPQGFGANLFVNDIAVGDLNGDGIPDVVTQTGAILFGDGKGGFARYDQYAVDGAAGVSIVDFNNDGINDLVFGGATADFIAGSQFSPSAVTVLFGLGSGKFAGAQVTGIPVWADPGATVSTQIVAGDFDGDGPREVATFTGISNPSNLSLTNSSAVQMTIMKATADGGLSIVAKYSTPHPSGFRAVTALSGDFNRDGKQDLLLLLRFDSGGSEIDFYAGRGDNTFDAAVGTPLAEQASFITAADLNRDGVPDLAGIARDLVWTRMGKGDGTFGPVTYSATPAPGGGVSIAFGDFTGDGKQDLAIASTDGSLAVLPGQGDGTFAPPVRSVIPGYFEPISDGLVTADMNGDGKLDVILQTAPGNITVMLGNGNGSFYPRNDGTYGAPYIDFLAAADFNRDGVPDLIGNFPYRGYSRAFTLLPGNEDGSLQPAITGPPSGMVIVADVNGDGAPDLVESNGAGVVVLLNISGSPGALTVVSGASFTPGPLAPGSFASAFGAHLAAASALGGVTVTVQDAAGVARAALVTYVSPGQINFMVPEGTARGPATVTVNGGGSQSVPVRAGITVEAIAPALFTAPGFYSAVSNSLVNVAAGYAVRVDGAGNQTYQSLFDGSGGLTPIDVAQAGTTFVALFGTGFDAANADQVKASIEGVPVRVTYAGPAPRMPGVDQINLVVPGSLAGKGIVFVSVAVQGVTANSVILPIR